MPESRTLTTTYAASGWVSVVYPLSMGEADRSHLKFKLLLSLIPNCVVHTHGLSPWCYRCLQTLGAKWLAQVGLGTKHSSPSRSAWALMEEQNLPESYKRPRVGQGECCCLSCRSGEGSWTCLASLVRMQRGTPCLCKTATCARWRWCGNSETDTGEPWQCSACGLRSTLGSLLPARRSLDAQNGTAGVAPVTISGGLRDHVWL